MPSLPRRPRKGFALRMVHERKVDVSFHGRTFPA